MKVQNQVTELKSRLKHGERKHQAKLVNFSNYMEFLVSLFVKINSNKT